MCESHREGKGRVACCTSKPAEAAVAFEKAWYAGLTDTDAVNRLHAISSSPLQQRLQVGPLQCVCMCQWRNVPAPPAGPLSSGCTQACGRFPPQQLTKSKPAGSDILNEEAQ